MVSRLIVLSFIRRRKILLCIGLAVLVAVSAALFAAYYISAHQEFWDTEHSLSMLTNRDYQKYFEPHIDDFIRNEGIQGTIDRTISAFAAGQIDMTTCHSLAHDIGHYGGYGTNFPEIGKYLNKQDLDFCGSGFIHGVEGQLANEPYPQNSDDLYAFCKMVQPLHPYYGGCYHGAGHSFKEETPDTNEALSWCDKLKFDDTIDPSDCYRGVFSQNFDDSTRLGKGDAYLLQYCASLSSEEMQEYCAMELNGLNLNADAGQDVIAQKFQECLDPQYSAVIQDGCIRSVTGVATDIVLGRRENIVPPPIVFTMPEDLIKSYIEYTYGAFIKTADIEPDRSLQTFCAAFSGTPYYEFCEKTINKTRT